MTGIAQRSSQGTGQHAEPDAPRPVCITNLHLARKLMQMEAQLTRIELMLDHLIRIEYSNDEIPSA